nr:immunoglobulin light chain junction region [Macaca mulatta]MOY06876.1 immunoglobulin light chain junction region [Macaca mulatta]MOY06959.1 immunoglobulin light chain junction region [Macaca mulatta]MOY08597.1 immunoglobulin light chain junction region [Macaca mulatta]
DYYCSAWDSRLSKIVF